MSKIKRLDAPDVLGKVGQDTSGKNSARSDKSRQDHEYNTGQKYSEAEESSTLAQSQSSDEQVAGSQTTAGADFPKQRKKKTAKARKKRSSIVDINSSGFDPSSAELWTTWSSYASVICCVNSYPNGVTVSLHTNAVSKNKNSSSKANVGVELGSGAPDKQSEKKSDLEIPRKFFPSQFHLRLRDTRDYQTPDGKYFLYKENAIRSLEKHLLVLHQKGLLSSSTIYFGTVSDPFSSFHKKFDITTACMELFEKYVPQRLVVQTRSPMIISALPALRRLRERVVVSVPIESHLEKSVIRYTPGQPRIAERLVAAEGLRRQGITVVLNVSPVLPYGDFYRDAWDFAEVLEQHADLVTFGCLASGTEADERTLKTLPIARKLASDKEFRWLRPHAYRYLYHALSVLAPQKLVLPVSPAKKAAQLDLFAA